MKTMKQMHEEILSKARWDGGWPRVIIVGPGIIALAKDQAHWDELRRSSVRAMLAGVVTALVIGAVVVWFCAT